MKEDEIQRFARRLSARISPWSTGRSAVAQAGLQQLAHSLRMFQVATAIDALAAGDTDKARAIAESIAEGAIEGVQESLPYAREAQAIIGEDGETDGSEQIERLIKVGEALLEAGE